MAEEVHPGPWRLWDETMGVQVLDANGNLVCFVEDAAAAHEIGAVPELVIGLAALCHEFEQVVAVPTAFGAYQKARQALAKAGGDIDA